MGLADDLLNLARRVIPITLMALFVTGAEARDVRIESRTIKLDIGEKKGHGVRSALVRNNLISAFDRRDPRYKAALDRLAPRFSGAEVIVGNHKGGFVFGISSDVQDINRLGLPVRITGKDCISSCTIFLGARDVCISPETRFGFHKPSPAPGTGRMTQVRLAGVNHTITSHYLPALKRWWDSNAGKSKRIVYLSGAELIRIGYRPCEDKMLRKRG